MKLFNSGETSLEDKYLAWCSWDFDETVKLLVESSPQQNTQELAKM